MAAMGAMQAAPSRKMALASPVVAGTVVAQRLLAPRPGAARAVMWSVTATLAALAPEGRRLVATALPVRRRVVRPLVAMPWPVTPPEARRSSEMRKLVMPAGMAASRLVAMRWQAQHPAAAEGLPRVALAVAALVATAALAARVAPRPRATRLAATAATRQARPAGLIAGARALTAWRLVVMVAPGFLGTQPLV